MLASSGGTASATAPSGSHAESAYADPQRRREIGIRLALGERDPHLRQRFLRHGLALSCLGLVTGLGISTIVTRLMASMLFGVGPVDWLTYVAVAILLMIGAAM